MDRCNLISWIRPLLLSASLLALAIISSLQATESARFTDALSLQQRVDAGLDQLTSDNVAVINALVRQDDAASELRHNTIRTTQFSQRRTGHERDIAGLNHLSPEQLAKLDELVGQRFAPATSSWLESPAVPSMLSVSAVESAPASPGLEMHGSFSLTYGTGKGGSFMGGDATLLFQDPEHRYSVLLNYSQYRGKGYLPWVYSSGPYAPFQTLPEMGAPDR